MRSKDDILTGNDPPPKTIALGTVYTATAEELHDFVVDPVAPLQSGRNFVVAEILGPDDIADYEGENGPGPVINFGHAYTQGVKDALTRARAGSDQAARQGNELGTLVTTVFTPIRSSVRLRSTGVRATGR